MMDDVDSTFGTAIDNIVHKITTQVYDLACALGNAACE